MRKFIAAVLFTVLVSSVFAQTVSQPRPAMPTPRPRALVAALGGRLAVLSSADGSASFIKGVDGHRGPTSGMGGRRSHALL
jgi:hypothetical protein